MLGTIDAVNLQHVVNIGCRDEIKNSPSEKTTIELLDSSLDQLLKEAKKKKEVSKKENAVKPCSNDFLHFQSDQFSYQKEEDQKFQSMFREQQRIDQEEHQRY